MQTLGVIPARYASSRFPGKPLVDINGKSMIQRVYEQVSQAPSIDQVVVATDDERIYEHCRERKMEVEMTKPSHQSGTDRCAEVASRRTSAAIIINIQGDEPFIQPEQIEQVILPFLEQKEVEITTLAKRIETSAMLFDPNTVKALFRTDGRALYFSRSAIPYLRGVEQEAWVNKGQFFKHIGIYGFRRNTLLAVAQMPVGRLEQWESLEQLRWLEQGLPIFVGITAHEAIGIDTPADLERAVAFLQNKER